MNLSTVKKINHRLQDCDQTTNFQVLIDTFHHPYLKVQNTFTLPSITLNGISDQEAESLTHLLIHNFPQLIAGHQLLPEPRPRKDTHQLHFIKELSFENEKYISLIKINALYMGGATTGEILEAGRQGVTPSIETDRIYFHARLIPVTSIKIEEGCITDFIARQVKEAIFYVSSRDTMRDVWSTILFDEVDFTQVNKKFTSFLAYKSPWPTAHFLPLLVDYLTICFTGITGNSHETIQVLPYFHRAFLAILDKGDCNSLNEEDRSFWNRYFQCFQFERISSKSGNPHWILKYEKFI